VLLKSALLPVAVLKLPVVVLESVPSPRNVLPLLSQPCSHTAPTCGESVRQAKMSVMKRPYRQGDWLIEFVVGMRRLVLVFIVVLVELHQA
jgi:hypothetical protein